jgi:hypothetical protein
MKTSRKIKYITKRYIYRIIRDISGNKDKSKKLLLSNLLKTNVQLLKGIDVNSTVLF